MERMPHKEVRKLIKIGTGSLGVTLPKPWCRYFALDETDTVEVISNGNVVITPLKKNSNDEGGGDDG